MTFSRPQDLVPLAVKWISHYHKSRERLSAKITDAIEHHRIASKLRPPTRTVGGGVTHLERRPDSACPDA